MRGFDVAGVSLVTTGGTYPHNPGQKFRSCGLTGPWSEPVLLAKSALEAPDSLYSGIKLYANESDVTMDSCNIGGPGDQDDKDDIGCCAVHALAACGFGLVPRLRPAKPSSAATHEFLRDQRPCGPCG